MKQWLAIAMVGLFFFSCKKEMQPAPDQAKGSNDSFFANVLSGLKDSLSGNDFETIDKTRWYKSKDARSKSYFVRIAVRGKEIATDFILLKTDSSGDIQEGRIIHADKVNDVKNADDLRFRGQFVISSLNRGISVTREVRDGRWKKPSDETSLLQEEPAGEQVLPGVVVTSYSYEGDYTGDWYWYDGFYDDDYDTGGGGYTYGYSGGGGGSAGTTTANHEDETMNIEIEPDNDPGVIVQDYLSCFSTIPDANATYKITLYADIPVNGDPSQIFDWSTNSPGHSFIQLNKYSGNQSIQQNLGFYPETGWKAPANVNVDSKIVDNAGHEFNASLSLNISGTQFQAALNQIQAISASDYNITTWNCTDFALSVFNAASPQPLTIPKIVIPTSTYPLPTTFAYSNTPQGLFDEIQSLQAVHNTTYGTTDIPGICGYVGDSHGSCQ